MPINQLFGFDGEGGGPSRAPIGAGKADASDVRHMEDKLDRLSLICMAMWSLLQDKTQLTEQDLMERVKLLDRMDGKEDGKATRSVTQCHACHRPMNPKHKKCIYCGKPRQVSSVFDML